MGKMKNLISRVKAAAGLFFYVMKGGEQDMIMVYVSLITKGLKAIADVPAALREQVKEMLISIDCGFLAE